MTNPTPSGSDDVPETRAPSTGRMVHPVERPPERSLGKPSGKRRTEVSHGIGGTRVQRPVPPRLSSPFEDEISTVLGNRLGLAALVILVASLIFLTKNLFVTNTLAFPTAFERLGLALMPSISLLVVVLLKFRKPWTYHFLRGMEWVLFGTITVFFTWLHIRHVTSTDIHHMVHGQEDAVGLMVLGMNSIWSFLILIYGVFIPNSWARCARMTIGCALIPLVMTCYLAWVQGEAAFLLASVFPATLMQVLAVAVAVFGSYRIRLLQRQAFEAQELGQYRLVELIGRGGMGEVYRAEHRLMRRPCAIKLIRPDRTGNQMILERFAREVEATASLIHPNTVTIFDYGHEEDGTFYYVMEYLQGVSFRQLVKHEGQQSVERTVRLLRQVCGSLHEAHSLGLVHRDINPNNLFICQMGRFRDVAKVLDFGLVKLSEGTDDSYSDDEQMNGQTELTKVGTVLGTPDCISPEQTQGLELDARCDLYGLGCVAYFLLAGQLPYVRSNVRDLLQAHRKEPVPPLNTLRPDVPPELEAIVLRCLAKEPANRFPDAATLDNALANCFSHLSLQLPWSTAGT